MKRDITKYFKIQSISQFFCVHPNTEPPNTEKNLMRNLWFYGENLVHIKKKKQIASWILPVKLLTDKEN